MFTRISTLAAAALVVLTISHSEALAQTKIGSGVGSNGQKFGNGVGSNGGQGGFKGVGSGPVASKGNNNAGFDVARALDLTQQIRALLQKTTADINKGTIALDAKDKQQILGRIRVAANRTNALQRLLTGKAVAQDVALQQAKVLENLLDQFRDAARDTGNDQLRDVARDLERLSDRLVDVID